jgi:hypothetical protein
LGTFLQSNLGSGHLAQGGQGGGGLSSLHFRIGGGQAGQTGGTTSDFNMYKSSFPGGIIFLGIPLGNELL